MTTREVFHIPWADIRAELDSVDLSKYSRIIGIARGGLTPASYLARRAHLRLDVLHMPLRGINAPYNSVVFASIGADERVLVVDEIVCRGRTFSELSASFRSQRLKFDFYALFVDAEFQREPEMVESGLSAKLSTQWVAFPWEPDNIIAVGSRQLYRDKIQNPVLLAKELCGQD